MSPRARPAPLAFAARAPAKVNLVLRVGPLRPDGFHAIASLFAPLDLADDVEVRVWRGRAGAVSCRCPGRPELDGPGNLAAKAALAFRLRFGVRDRVAIRVVKRIPVTAGLGGGSSDAAATLRCLARAYGVRDRAALAAVALGVGSDVPFFLGAGPAWAAGRGEALRPAALPALHLLLAYPRDPALAIRAGDAYRWLDEARGRGARSARHAVRSSRRAFRPGDLANDLEAPCVARHPAIGRLREALLEAGAAAAAMSGSGPTVFGLFEGAAAARLAARALEGVAALGVEVHPVRTLGRLPGARAAGPAAPATSRPSRAR